MLGIFIFNFAFFLGLILSIIASHGIGLFHSLMQELISIITFKLLVCIMLIASGVIGLLSYFTVGNFILNLVNGLSKKLHKIFFPIASGLLGTISGMTLYAIIDYKWTIALKGMLVLLLVWGQIWMSTGHLHQSLYFLNRKKNGDKEEAFAILVVSSFLLISGLLGIWDMLTKSYT
ncbi:hypothetical protein O1C64_003299 [Vibrio cholerae]|nr:hypothetical protein [Vibrio cholerae]